MNTWAKGLARNLRDGGLGSAWGYLRAGSIRRELPRLADRLGGQTPFEIHALVGAARMEMALWMFASWMLATRSRWQFVIHDDGTLRPEDASEVASVLPGARVVLAHESHDEMRKALAAFPASWKCRNLHPLCRKLFDIPHYAGGTKFLTIDTDILFFREPARLLRWIEGNESTTIFLEDVADATLPSAVEAAEALGRTVQPKINTGIVAMPKSAVTLEDLENCLTKTHIMDEDSWFIEQSLYAVLASLRGRVELLGADYYMQITGAVPHDAVARHYMGKIRHRFYTEGLSMVRGLSAAC